MSSRVTFSIKKHVFKLGIRLRWGESDGTPSHESPRHVNWTRSKQAKCRVYESQKIILKFNDTFLKGIIIVIFIAVIDLLKLYEV